jgi:putative hydrolase of the HAD superfamily
MTISINSDSHVVLDLDDTLYAERDFQDSGFQYISARLNNVTGKDVLKDLHSLNQAPGKNVFRELVQMHNLEAFNIDINTLINWYRFHKPEIRLYPDALHFLNKLASHSIGMSLITDGRSITQRNKINALGLNSFFLNIIISEEIGSEKPALKNYQLILDSTGVKKYFYFADNPQKDFITPNNLGWVTGCLLDRGKNIHPQMFNCFSQDFLPKHCIRSFDDIIFKK